MVGGSLQLRFRAVLAIGVTLAMSVGCQSGRRRTEFLKQIDKLQRQNEELEREVAVRDGTIAGLRQQIVDLQAFDPDRPVDLFSPVMVEIASLSGGADYDGELGDDGVTVYLRPRDADGDVVKVPGQIKIQLLDNSDMNAPRVLAVCEYSKAEELRRLWFSRFGTNHYTLKCPFVEGVTLPASRKVTVSAFFLDYRTGATLTAVKQVDISFPDR